MLIKTADGEKNVASQALGGTSLGLAIPGTIALANQVLGGGLLNGVFGGAGSCAGGTVSDTRTIGLLESELAKEKAERYADSIGIAAFKEAKIMFEKAQDTSSANFKEVVQGFIAQNEINAKEFARLDKEVALNKQASEYNFAILNNKIDCCGRELRCYVDGTFVPGKLVMPKDNICPEVMARYNSWTAPTTTTTTG
jgi:hypothetical protein